MLSLEFPEGRLPERSCLTMSRSYRVPYSYTCCGAHPQRGKKFLSRKLRRKAKDLCHKARFVFDVDREDFDASINHPQDKNRGRAGSRDYSWGWDYYGDGRYYYGNRHWEDGNPDLFTDTIYSEVYRRKGFRKLRNPWGGKAWKEATEWTIKLSRK